MMQWLQPIFTTGKQPLAVRKWQRSDWPTWILLRITTITEHCQLMTV